MSRTDNRTLSHPSYNSTFRRVVDAYLQNYFGDFASAAESIRSVERWIHTAPLSLLDREMSYAGYFAALRQVGELDKGVLATLYRV